MHSAKRSEIEKEIQKRLAEVCEEKGFIIEAVLLKSISLPPGLTKSIETKLEAEQEALRMEFVLLTCPPYFFKFHKYLIIL